MKKILLSIIVVSIVLFLVCAAGQQGIKEPTADDTMVIIGRVIVEDRGFTEDRKVYKKSIEVAIIGKTQEGKETGFWTITDEQGYFAISNAPKGEYALKGIRLSVGRGDLITITNRLRYRSDLYNWQYKTEIIFNGSYFPFEPSGRIQNLQHTLFSLDFTNKTLPQVRSMNNNVLKNIELINGETLNEEPVEVYFIQKHPESSWRGEFEASMEENRYPQ